MASVTSSVREAEVGESAAVCATLADAFATEPVLKFLFPAGCGGTRASGGTSQSSCAA
jgi:hypothetical protein